MNTAFQAVLVGSGFIGPAHLEAMRHLRIEVNGLVDAQAEIARKRADALGIGHTYSSWKEALAVPLAAVFQIIQMAVPNLLHFLVDKKVLLADKLCDL